MSNENGFQEEIARKIRDAVYSYGKVGLLIDDAFEASSRIARELYGAEVLPRWWFIARSMRCAIPALDAVLEALGRNSSSEAIVLVDRFLPLECGGGRDFPFDELQIEGITEEAKALGSLLVAQIVKLHEEKEGRFEGRLHSALITSYPLASAFSQSAKSHPITWQTRDLDLLPQLRRMLEEENSRLLSYGPEEDSPCNNGRVGDDAWRARNWKDALRQIAENLQNPMHNPVLLITGAGFSLASGPFGAGMPTTDWLIEETVHLLAKHKRGGVKPGIEPGRLRQPPSCAHVPERKAQRKPLQCKSGEELPLLLDALEAGKKANSLNYKLERIFMHRKDRPANRIKDFYTFFRMVLHRFDQGFTYQHWLVAGLPWQRIITTNFDGFHERAAMAHAAAARAKPEETLYLGNAFPILGEPGLKEIKQKGLKQLYETCRLFKLYGSLDSPGPLAFSIQDFEVWKHQIKYAFKIDVRLESLTIVVIGQAMMNSYLVRQIESLSDKLKDRLNLFWVDPEAYGRLDQEEDSWWHSHMNPAYPRNPTDAHACLLPATAAEFCHDLAREFAI